MRRTLLLAATAIAPLCAASPSRADALSPGHDKTVSEVVVTAAPYAVSLDTITSSVNVVSQDALAIAPPAGIGDALNGLPGVRSTAYGPGASRPVIRGLSGPRVMVLQNGVGMVDASALSPDHAVASDPADASRIEVLRGPSTLAYGGSGIGGVVNVIDDRVPSAPAQDGFEGRVSASASSADSGRAGALSLKAGSGPWVVSATASHRKSEDYDTPVAPVSPRMAAQDGLTIDPAKVQRNTDVEVEEYGVGGSYIHDAGYFGMSVKKTDSTYGVPYPQILAPIDPNDEGPVAIHLKQVRVDARGEQRIDLGPFDKVRFSAGWADYNHSEISRVDGAVGTKFLSDGAEGRLELVQKARDGWQGAVGLQALKRNFEAIGDEAFVPPVDIEEVGAFTLQRLDRGGWGVDGGLRVDRRKLTADLATRPDSQPAIDAGFSWATAPTEREFTNVSASLGLFYKPADPWFLAVTLSRNGRAPTEFELYADGPHPGTGGYELGDPTLGSETVVSVEGTVRFIADGWRVEGHIWRADYDGYIEQRRTGAIEDNLPVFAFVETGAEFQGAELEASKRLWRSGERTLSAEGDFDVVRGDTDLGPPARTPPWSATARLIYGGPRIEGQIETRHVARQTRLAPLELPTDAYTVVNVILTWKPSADPKLRLYVEGRNLGDVEAREHASFLKDVSVQPGRSLRAGVAWRF